MPEVAAGAVDQVQEDPVPEDQVPEDQIPGDQVTGDPVQGTQVREDRVPHHRSGNLKIAVSVMIRNVTESTMRRLAKDWQIVKGVNGNVDRYVLFLGNTLSSK